MNLKFCIYSTCKKCFGALLLLLFLTPATAQKLTAKVDKKVVEAGEIFTLTYSIDADADDFKAPDLQGVEVLSGPNYSNRISVFNLKMQRTTSYSYKLRALSEGKLVLPGAAVKSGGKTYRSNSVVIAVKKQAQQHVQNQPNTNAGNAEVFIRLVLNKNTVYQGQAVELSCKLYVRDIELEQYNSFKNPSFSGFWAEDVPLHGPTELQAEKYNGKMYAVGVIKKMLLYPQKSGKLTIDPIEVECIGRKEVGEDAFKDFLKDFPTGDIFKHFEPVRLMVSSSQVSLNVKPLPAGKPQNFSGFVGKAVISAKVDHANVKTGEPFEYTVRVSGNGNFNLVQPFDIKIAGADVYTPDVQDDLQRTTELEGTKTFIYNIVPQKTGKLNLPPLQFSYFDAEKQQYVTATAEAIPIYVEKGENLVENPVIKNEAEAQEKTGLPVWVYGAAAAGIVVLAFIFFGIIKKKKPVQVKVNNTPGAVKPEVKAPYVAPVKNAWATENLISAEHALTHGKIPGALNAMLHAYYAWLQQFTGLTQANLTHDEIEAALVQNEVHEHKRLHILHTLKMLEEAQYAPTASVTQKQAAEILENLRKMLLNADWKNS